MDDDRTRDAPRIVLDTNACLDLLLFEDPRCGTLRAALRGSRVHAVADGPCRDEWLRVLAYPQLRLDQARRAALIDAFDALMQPWDPRARSSARPLLPRCKDPDDQKFLELAYAAQARWLVSRDRDLLALGRRTAAAGLFDITTPQAWADPGFHA